MPAVFQLPQAPNIGLGLLGQVLLGGATDYANSRRSDDREARQRAQRLADVQDDRAYEQKTHERGRTERLSDVTSDRAYARETSDREARVAFAREMVRTGYLAPDKVNDDAAVNEAATRFGRDGLAQRYTEAIKTGDLAYADLGDAARVAAGLEKFSQRLAKSTQFRDALPEQAQARAGQLVGEREQLLTASSELERRLAEPEPSPTAQQVSQLALRIAQQAKKPGEMPSMAEISQAAPQAEETLRGQMAQRWNQQRQDALVQRSLLQDRLRDVSSELNTLTNRFGVVGVADRAAAPVSQPAGRRLGFDVGTQFPPPSAPPSLAAAQQNFAATLAAELAKSKNGGMGGAGGSWAEPASEYPPYSVIGAGQRAIAALPAVGKFISEIPGAVAKVPVAIDRAAGALGGGLLTGDYSAPAVGGLGQIGEGIVSGTADANDAAEQEVLLKAPYSVQAYEIRRRRGLPQPNTMNGPTGATPPPVGVSSQWWKGQ